MLWLIRLLLKISRPYPHLYHEDGSLYMGRFTLVKIKRLLHIRLHHIATADLGRHPHDHPWTFLTVVLRGGYTEERVGRRTIVRRPFSVALRRYFDIHHVSSVEPRTWTLVICGPVRRSWGFYLSNEFVDRKAYKSKMRERV